MRRSFPIVSTIWDAYALVNLCASCALGVDCVDYNYDLVMASRVLTLTSEQRHVVKASRIFVSKRT